MSIRIAFINACISLQLEIAPTDSTDAMNLLHAVAEIEKSSRTDSDTATFRQHIDTSPHIAKISFAAFVGKTTFKARFKADY